MNTKSNIGLKITLLAIAFLAGADLVIIPASGEIFATFADANPAILNLVLTGPLFTAMISSIVVGLMAKKFTKRSLLIGAQIIFLIGSLGGALIENVYYMVIMRLLVGFGYGAAGVIVVSFIVELYKEEKERSTLIGAYNAAIAALGIVASIVSGYLAVMNWHYSFYVYAFGILVLILSFIFLPSTPPEGEVAADESQDQGIKQGFPVAKVAIVSLAALVYSALYCLIGYFLAIYLGEVGMESAATAGIFTSFMTIGQFLSGFVFAFLFMRLHRGMPVMLFAVAGLAYLLMFVLPNAGVIGVALVVLGAMYGCALSYYLMHIESIVPANSVSIAVAFVQAAFLVGGFLSSYLLIGFQAMMRTEAIGPTFLPVAVTLFAGAAISLVLFLRSRKSTADQAA